MQNFTWISYLLFSVNIFSQQAWAKWFEINGTEFYLTTYSGEAYKSWQVARTFCMDSGADLTSLHSQAEVDQIMAWSRLESWFRDDYWLGFNNIDREGYRWSDKSDVDFKNWADGYPKTNNLGKYCVFTKPKTEGFWYNEHCGLQKGFICRRPAGVTPSTIVPPTTTLTPGFCPDNYFDAGNKCFKIITKSEEDGATFEEAVDRCRRETTSGLRPDIACIHSQYENAVITSKMHPFQENGLWIGLQNLDDKWLWVDNRPVAYLNWADKMPDRYSGNCAMVAYKHPPTGHTGTWFNSKCKNRMGYLCQVEKDPGKIISTPPSTTPNLCAIGYIPYNKGCYKFFTEGKSWEDANSTCVDGGASLASIHSEPENAALYSLLVSHKSETWIGLYDSKQTNGAYHWSDGWYVMYTRWDKDQPKQEAGGGCVVMTTKNGKWKDEVCAEPKPFICKTTTASPITTPAHIEGKCPQGWTPYGEHCYTFERNGRGTWIMAQEKCTRKNQYAQLVSIHSVAENDFVHKNMLATDPWADAWIGLYRGKDGDFRWVDGSTLQYSHWMPGSPDPDDTTDKKCVVMSMKEHPKLWMDITCNYNEGFICKAPKVPLPTPPPETPGACLQGWSPYGSDCYWFEPDLFQNWEGAQQFCKQKGGETADLAWINHEHENDFINEQMKAKNDLPTTRDYWIGARKSGKDKPYLWPNGNNVTTSFWLRDYPTSDPNGILNCVVVDFSSGLWKNTVCDHIRGLVCKSAKQPITTTGITTTHVSSTSEKLTSNTSPSIRTEPTNISPVPSHGPQNTGVGGGTVAAIILGLLLLASVCLHVVFIMRDRFKMAPGFRPFNNPLRNPELSRDNEDDMHEDRSVEFRHGSTMSKDNVQIHEAH